MAGFVHQHSHHHLTKTLCDFEDHIACETVADDDVDVGIENIAAFDIATEVDACRLEDPVALTRLRTAFALILSDRHQTHPGRIHTEDRLRVERAHDGELHELVWLALHVGADIEDQGMTLFLGHHCGQSRPVDAVDHPEGGLGSDPGGAGVAGGHHGGRPTLAHERCTDVER